jgi:hypothetical protein
MSKSTELKRVEIRREQIASQMLQIRSVVRGALTEQFLRVEHKGEKEPVVRGPYYVLSRSHKGKTQSRRVAREEAGRVRHQVDNYKRLEALFGELTELTERLGELEREAATDEALKKGLKSRSRRAGKSRA